MVSSSLSTMPADSSPAAELASTQVVAQGTEASSTETPAPASAPQKSRESPICSAPSNSEPAAPKLEEPSVPNSLVQPDNVEVVADQASQPPPANKRTDPRLLQAMYWPSAPPTKTSETVE